MVGKASDQDVRKHILNACVQWARARGYSDAAGVLWSLVVLAKESISLDELVAETGYSKSTVSVNMRLLENLGLVKRIVIPGDKRHVYVPITDLNIIRTNMLDPICEENQLFLNALDRTEKDLKAKGEEGYLLERVSNLRESCECGKKMFEAMKNHLDKLSKLPE